MDKEFADSSVVGSKEWKRSGDDGEIDPGMDDRLMEGDEEREDGGLAVHSLSGKERNHLFLNGDWGKGFADVSALSGMDSDSDARCFVLLDYDRDGWSDVAVVNANQPLMQLFHNDIAQLPGMNGGMVAIRFVGGNTTPGGSEFCNRDGYGAMVELGLPGGVKLKREHRCGEGYAAQNSATMIVGIGSARVVDSLSVRWPSGRVTEIEGVEEGALITAYENRPTGAFTKERYRIKGKISPARKRANQPFPVAQNNAGKVQVYTTTATWCAACITHLPALAQLEQDGVALYGVPIDPNDDAEKLGEYVEEKSPPYQMLAEMSVDQKEQVNAFLAAALKMENPVLPSSVITDGEGNVLEVIQGVPSLSQVRKWMALDQ